MMPVDLQIWGDKDGRTDGLSRFRVTNNRTWVKEVAVTLKVEYRVRVGAHGFDVIRDAGIAAREARGTMV